MRENSKNLLIVLVYSLGSHSLWVTLYFENYLVILRVKGFSHEIFFINISPHNIFHFPEVYNEAIKFG